MGTGRHLWVVVAGCGHRRFHGQSASSQSNDVAHLLTCHVVGRVLAWFVTWQASLLLWLVVVVSGWRWWWGWQLLATVVTWRRWVVAMMVVVGAVGDRCGWSSPFTVWAVVVGHCVC